MTEAQTKPSYVGKFFYKVKPVGDGITVLIGPLETIRYASSLNGSSSDSGYAFVEVVEGTPTQAFREEEILVTTRKL